MLVILFSISAGVKPALALLIRIYFNEPQKIWCQFIFPQVQDCLFQLKLQAALTKNASLKPYVKGEQFP